MSTSLPPNANLTQLKHQAKDLLKAHKRGDPECCTVLRQLRQFADLADADILGAGLKLDDAQFALAMHYGFEGWAALKDHVQAATGEKTMSAAVYGRVTAEEGGQPIEDAEVRVELADERHDPVAHVRVRTDSDGRYHCDLEWARVKRPTLRYQAKHVAYACKCDREKESDEALSRLLRVRDGQRHELNITLQDGFTLELTAIDEDGVPVEGAEVRIHSESEIGSGPYTADRVRGKGGLFGFEFPKTDARGFCRIEGIPYALSPTFRRADIMNHPRYGVLDLTDIEKLPREAGVARMTVRLPRRYRLTGRVVCAQTGRPIEGARIMADGVPQRGGPTDAASSHNEVTTDAAGHFGIPGLLDCPHDLFVRHSGWTWTEVNGVDVPSAEPLIIRLARDRVITGEVLDREGKPAVGAEIRVVSAGELRRFENEAFTDESGHFEIGGLSMDRRLWLAAKHESPFEAYGLAEVPPGEQPHLIFDGREMVELRGVVVDEVGRPVPVRVYCIVWGDAQQVAIHLAASVPLDIDGAFRALLPPNGNIIITLLSEEDCFASPFYNAERISMHNGQPDRLLTFTANPPNQLRLRFLDAQSGQPVSPVDVMLYPATNHWNYGWDERSDQDGVAVFEYLPTGDVEVRVVAAGYEAFWSGHIPMPTDEEIVIRLTPKV